MIAERGAEPHQRRQREPALGALDLRDRARRHAREIAEVVLAELACATHRAQRGGHAPGELRRREHRPPGLRGASAGPCRARRRRGPRPWRRGRCVRRRRSTHCVTAWTVSCTVSGVSRTRHRPVGDRAELEQHRAAAGEEVARRGWCPTRRTIASSESNSSRRCPRGWLRRWTSRSRSAGWASGARAGRPRRPPSRRCRGSVGVSPSETDGLADEDVVEAGDRCGRTAPPAAPSSCQTTLSPQ